MNRCFWEYSLTLAGMAMFLIQTMHSNPITYASAGCTNDGPGIIGTVDKFARDQQKWSMELKDGYSLDESILSTKTNFVDTDQYRDIVQEYVSNDHVLAKSPYNRTTFKLDKYNSALSYDEALQRVTIQADDIIVEGPPLNPEGLGCTHGFFGVFSENGTLKFAIIASDSYRDYRFGNSLVKVEPEPDTKHDCTVNRYKTTKGSDLLMEFCNVQARFSVIGEVFELAPQHSHAFPQGSAIEGIALIGARAVFENGEYMPGRVQTSVTYVIDFREEAIQRDESQKLTFFQRIFIFIKRYFTR